MRDDALVQPTVDGRRPRLLKGRRHQPGTRPLVPLVERESGRLPLGLVLALARLAAQPSQKHLEAALVGEHGVADQAEERSMRTERRVGVERCGRQLRRRCICRRRGGALMLLPQRLELSQSLAILSRLLEAPSLLARVLLEEPGDFELHVANLVDGLYTGAPLEPLVWRRKVLTHLGNGGCGCVGRGRLSLVGVRVFLAHLRRAVVTSGAH